MKKYKVIRFFKNHYERMVVKENLTKKEAQEICRSDESSSRTCSKATKKSVEEECLNRQIAYCDWFNGYDEMS